MSAYDDPDQLRSERLRELVRLAGAGELSDVSTEPGSPFEQGLHLTGHALNGRAEGQDGAELAAAHGHDGAGRNRNGAARGPEEPDVPDGPHAPETPHAPDTPEVPDSPELPPHEAPQAPDLPNLPGVPDAPDVHGPDEMPAIPDAPDILRTPEIPPAPDIPPAPEPPDSPDLPDAPEIHESPGIHDQPEIPDPPRIDDPELPEADRPAELPGTPGDPASPDAPDLPRPPALPDVPPPAPGGPDAARDAVTAMHSNHTDDSQLPDERGRSGHQQPVRPGDAARAERPVRGRSGKQAGAEGAAALPPAAGGHGGAGASGGGPAGTGGGRGRGGGKGTGEGGGTGGGVGGTGGAGNGEGDVEAALRRMLHQSVRDIEPAAESLAYLRHAVPARRAHRRRVLAGAAAAVVLVGVGVPGLMSTGLMPGMQGDTSYNAGDNHDQSHSTGGAEGPGLTEGAGSTLGGANGSGGKSGGGDGSASPSASRGGGSEGADPNESLATSAPSCGRQQLGDGSAREGSPDSDGKVYGSFRVVNTSADACTVEGEGVVGASAHGRADIERINVLDHTAGDAAVGLPDPDLAASELVLKPGEAYEVKWAWVPADCQPAEPPEPKVEEGNGPEGAQGGAGAGGNGPGGNSGGGDSGGSTGGPDTGGNQGDSGDGGETDKKASVVLSHTPDVGDPAAADTELEGACAGTLYRTGVLAAG